MRRFKNILVVCDEVGGLQSLQNRVAWLAKANEASVTLMHVVEEGTGWFGATEIKPDSAEALAGQIDEAHRGRLEDVASQLKQDGVAVETEVRRGAPVVEIIRRVLRNGHDLVMKAAQPQPNWPLLTGVDMHLIRKCPSAVWIVKSTAPARATHIVAAVDPDPEDAARDNLSHTVMQLATSLAKADEARLDVLNAWTLHDESTLRRGRTRMREEEVDQLVAQHRSACESRLNALVEAFDGIVPGMRSLCVKGRAADVIPEHAAADGVDTIVMGSVGRTGVAGLFIGNTAETILNRVDCSVLTVKAEGFVSPVTLDA